MHCDPKDNQANVHKTYNRCSREETFYKTERENIRYEHLHNLGTEDEGERGHTKCVVMLIVQLYLFAYT